MERTPNTPTRGLTAIELLIAISILGLLAVFGIPMMNSTIWATDLDQAAKITEETVDQARAMARLYKTDVTVRLESAEDQPPVITLSISRSRQNTVLGQINEEIELPGEVAFVNGDLMMQFDAEGNIDFPAMVTIASTADRDDYLKLVID
jgi:prepilin-type N-terminal cleavage/methylation domain-containing protein